uniref:Uncharacterized protein n=1 Tax=Nelumbo nucifera TaxID=4432 RepID=A0A822XMS0_NELNU|nr:TPA_asm: hypothetical protein HUJ06_023133 [Nelumbo nucifera]
MNRYSEPLNLRETSLLYNSLWTRTLMPNVMVVLIGRRWIVGGRKTFIGDFGLPLFNSSLGEEALIRIWNQ